MNRRGSLSQGARATIAVLALYGLVLQVFLAGLAPPVLGKAHGFAELCAPAQDGGEAPVKQDRHGCCAALCSPLATPLAPVGATLAAWPEASTRVVSSTAPPAARGPPTRAHSPRGPPTA